jgi:arylsulfatase B
MSHNYTDTPLFLLLAHMAPHFSNYQEPAQAPPNYIDRVSHIKHPERRKYAGMVTALDDSVGKVMQALRAKNVSQNTIVIFMSDNGGGGLEQTKFLPFMPVIHGSNWPLRGATGSQYVTFSP